MAARASKAGAPTSAAVSTATPAKTAPRVSEGTLKSRDYRCTGGPTRLLPSLVMEVRLA